MWYYKYIYFLFFISCVCHRWYFPTHNPFINPIFLFVPSLQQVLLLKFLLFSAQHPFVSTLCTLLKKIYYFIIMCMWIISVLRWRLYDNAIYAVSFRCIVRRFSTGWKLTFYGKKNQQNVMAERQCVIKCNLVRIKSLHQSLLIHWRYTSTKGIRYIHRTALIINYPKGNHYHVRIQQPTNLPLKTLQEFFFHFVSSSSAFLFVDVDIFWWTIIQESHVHIQTFGIETFLFHRRNVTFSFWELFYGCWLSFMNCQGFRVSFLLWTFEFRSIWINIDC